MPNGFGSVNEKGIAFYDALINELLENGIEPYITLYHWELPYEIYKCGGWMNPQCFVGLAFLTGEHAPGVHVPLRDTFEMSHNVLKAHGRAVQMLRQKQ